MNITEQIRKSIETLVRTRPAYREILGFYGRVFELQEQSMKQIDLEPVRIDPELLKVKKENEMPLIEISQFPIDIKAAEKVLIETCRTAEALVENLAENAGKLLQAVETHSLSPEILFKSLLDDTGESIETFAGQLGLDSASLRFFGFLSIAPSIKKGAQLTGARYLDSELIHNQGYCPVCGGKPDLAVLDESGKQQYKCGNCSYLWHVKRLGCLFCSSSDPEKQHYFYSETEKEYRVNLCDDCGNYIKVVDLRQINRPFHPGIEAVSTLHLDFKAREKGYSSLVGF